MSLVGFLHVKLDGGETSDSSVCKFVKGSVDFGHDDFITESKFIIYLGLNIFEISFLTFQP